MKAKMADSQTWKVTLNGLTDIMFDRYAGDNKTQLPPEKKMYLDGKTIVLPCRNILSFLSAENTESAPKRFFDPRKYKTVARAFRSFTSVSPFLIPFTGNGKPIEFNGFGNEADEGEVYVAKSVARLKEAANPKERPVLKTPWQLSFEVHLIKNGEVGADTLRDMFDRGGMAIGLGTYRGVYGKFAVAGWELV